MLFALGCVVSLIPAVVAPVLKREPLNMTFVAVTIMFFGIAVVFFAISRKSAGQSRPPGA